MYRRVWQTLTICSKRGETPALNWSGKEQERKGERKDNERDHLLSPQRGGERVNVRFLEQKRGYRETAKKNMCVVIGADEKKGENMKDVDARLMRIMKSLVNVSLFCVSSDRTGTKKSGENDVLHRLRHTAERRSRGFEVSAVALLLAVELVFDFEGRFAG